MEVVILVYYVLGAFAGAAAMYWDRTSTLSQSARALIALGILFAGMAATGVLFMLKENGLLTL